MKIVQKDADGRRYWMVDCSRCGSVGTYYGYRCGDCRGTGLIVRGEGEAGGPPKVKA